MTLVSIWQLFQVLILFYSRHLKKETL